MKAEIKVKDREEARLLRLGLALADVRAFVKICGVLSRLPTKRAQERVLRFVADSEQERTANKYLRHPS